MQNGLFIIARKEKYIMEENDKMQIEQNDNQKEVKEGRRNIYEFMFDYRNVNYCMRGDIKDDPDGENRYLAIYTVSIDNFIYTPWIPVTTKYVDGMSDMELEGRLMIHVLKYYGATDIGKCLDEAIRELWRYIADEIKARL